MNKGKVFSGALLGALFAGVFTLQGQVYNGGTTTTINTSTTWSQDAFIGRTTSSNRLNINGGAVVTQTDGYSLTIGETGPSKSNSLYVSGAGSEFLGNTIIMGADAASTPNILDIKTGGKVTLSGQFSLSASGGANVVYVDGDGSALTADSILMGGGSISLSNNAYVKTNSLTSTGIFSTISLYSGATLETASFTVQKGQTYSAPLMLRGGKLKLTETGSSIGIINLYESTSTIEVNDAKTFTFSSDVTGSGGLVKSGAGTLLLTGTASTLYGNVTANEGILKFGDNSSTSYMMSSSGSGTLVTNSEIQFSYNGTVTLNRAFSGSGDLTVANGGLNLNAVNTMTGRLKAANGTTLSIIRREALFNGNSALWLPEHIIIGEGATLRLLVGGTNQLTADDLTSFLDADHMGGGTATTGFLDGARLSINTGTANGTTFTVNTNIVNANGGANALTLIKDGETGGNAILELKGSGANTYSGGTVINSGWIKAYSAPGTGAITGSVTSGNGGFIYGAAFDDLPSFEMTQGSLDTNGFDVLVNSIKSNSFYKRGVGTLTIGQGATANIGGLYVYGGTLKVLTDIVGTGSMEVNANGNTSVGVIFDGVKTTRQGIAVLDSGTYASSLQLLNGAQITGGNSLLVGTTATSRFSSLLIKGKAADGTSSSISVSSGVRLGYSGSNNTLTLEDGAQLINTYTHSTDAATIGYGATADATQGNNNTATLRGAGTKWANGSGGVKLGVYGSGNSLLIEDGAVFESGDTIIGDGTTNTGGAALGNSNSLKVTGAGSKWTGKELRLGNFGSGNSLAIEDGGEVSVTRVYQGTGYTDPTLGRANSLRVTGTGSKLTTGEFNMGYMGSENTLFIGSGAVVSTGVFVQGYGYSSNVNLGKSNQATITGAGSKLTTGNFTMGYLGSNNTLLIDDGALVQSAVTKIGAGHNSVTADYGKANSATVKGAGTKWTSTGAFSIGEYGSENSLTIQDGAVVSSVGAKIGGGVTGNANYGKSNTATITGTNSMWLNTGALTIGDQGNANSMLVQDGGWVDTTGDIVIGYGGSSFSNANNGLNNSLKISGAHSIVSTDGSLYVGGLASNYRSTGNTVTIEDRALLVVGDSTADTIFVRTASTATNNVMRLDGGYIALFGERSVAQMESLLYSSGFQVYDLATSTWVTPSADNITFLYFAATEEGAAAAKEFTGGLYDNLGGYTLVSSVPEPSTWALLGLGVIAMGYAIHRRRSMSACR